MYNRKVNYYFTGSTNYPSTVRKYTITHLWTATAAQRRFERRSTIRGVGVSQLKISFTSVRSYYVEGGRQICRAKRTLEGPKFNYSEYFCCSLSRNQIVRKDCLLLTEFDLYRAIVHFKLTNLLCIFKNERKIKCLRFLNFEV